MKRIMYQIIRCLIFFGLSSGHVYEKVLRSKQAVLEDSFRNVGSWFRDADVLVSSSTSCLAPSKFIELSSRILSFYAFLRSSFSTELSINPGMRWHGHSGRVMHLQRSGTHVLRFRALPIR
jgi:hypothetical protein